MKQKCLFNEAQKSNTCVCAGVRAIVLDVATKQQRLSLGLKASFFAEAEEEDEEGDAEVGVNSGNLNKHHVLIPRAMPLMLCSSAYKRNSGEKYHSICQQCKHECQDCPDVI